MSTELLAQRQSNNKPSPLRDETAALYARIAEDGAQRDILLVQVVRLNMRVADAVASRYDQRGVPIEDLRQIAYLGLIKAAQRFDAARPDASFLSFAIPTMRGEIRRYFRDHGWMVRPTRRIQELQQRVGRASQELSQNLERSPRPSEIAAHLDEPEDAVIEALSADGCFVPASLDLPVGADGSGATLGEFLPSEDSAFNAAEARVTLQPALGHLKPRDQRILGLRFVEGLTQREIGERLGLSQMQVSRLLNRILSQLRAAIGEPHTPSAA